MGHDLRAGAYESLHTAALDAALSASPFTPRYAAVSGASAPEVLARHVAETLTRALSSIADPAVQIATVNELLTRLTATPDPVIALEQLVTLTEQVSSGVHRLIPEPTIKLSDVALLTNAKDQPNLGAALGSELGSADRVDLLCAFIRYSGIRIIRDQLRQLRDRAVPFRVLTTTYMGATERRAIDQLVRDLGADVRISYNARSTRLHAKAWLFHRSSGFDTGFVGSSNLSHAAMVDGLEWNVRISAVATPTLVRQFSAAFDTYWNDDAFVPYDPDVDGGRLEAALAEAHGPGVRRPVDIAYPLVPPDDLAGSPPSGTAVVPRLSVVPTPSGPQVRPYPHQEQMLEALDVERTIHDRHRNLLVAATGTGKTVVAALDYLRLCETPVGVRRCCSWRTAGRSCSRACAPTATSWVTRPSGRSSLTGLGPPSGATCSRASRASRGWTSTPPSSPSWSSTSSTTPKRRPTSGCWTRCARRSCSA